MPLTQDQETALERFREWLRTDSCEFALVGYAGTGKSWLTKLLLDELPGPVVAAAPSHKAKQVLSDFLGIGVLTVSALSGERMASREAEAEKEEFVRMGQGKLKGGFVLIDEISMVRADQYEWIRDTTVALGGRVIIVGDPAQLRPVQGRPVRVGAKTFPHHAVLREIVRSDDTLAQLGLSVREGLPVDGVRRVPDLQADFLQEAEGLGDVYLAFTNVEVQAVQEAACQQRYGHGKDDVVVGETIRAENTQALLNSELAVVESCEPITDQWGEPAWRARVGGKTCVLVPFARKGLALRAAQKARAAWGKDDRRVRVAWAHYYHLVQRCQLFSHPMAMTIHKSQGSTFDRVWADLDSLLDHRPLAYVAATRARHQLTIEGDQQ